jgi:preprotein translocase subunit SecG
MYIVFSVLILIVAILLVLIVLVQNSKGGGLASGFASSNQFMGVRKTADFLEKATWTLATALILFCVTATLSIPKGEEVKRSAIEEQVNKATEPGQMPTFPTTPSNNTSTPKKEDKKP